MKKIAVLLTIATLAVLFNLGSAAPVQSSHLVVVDPGAWPDGTDLTSAFSGVTLSLLSPVISGHVTNNTPPLEPTYFIQAFDPDGLDATWTENTDFPRSLRVDFAQPASFVAIDIYLNESFGDSEVVGRLQAFDAGGVLLESYATAVLIDPTAFETASINRTSADIAYIIVTGVPAAEYSMDGVKLTNLQYISATD